MFVLTNNVSAGQKAIATLLATAVVMWTIGFHATAQAANVTNVSNLITDSAPGVDATHTFTFTIPSELNDTESVVLDFDAADGFDFTGFLTGDVTITPADGNWDAPVVDTGNDDVTITRNTSAVATSTVITVTLGATNFINNPTAPAGGNESYEIDISAGTNDGYARIVILDTVLVTAQVLTTFDFTVFSNATSSAVNGTTTTNTSSTTTIPFGVLTANTPEIISQDLTVVSNAANGFVVTVQTDGAFESSTGADIDTFDDSTIAALPAAWSAPGNLIADENTWGHWGVTSEDTDTDGARANEFGSDEWVGVETTPIPVFAHDGPSDGVTAGAGSTTVGYQVEISPLQEAGDDYSTVLTYIATPTF
jgi:hypothetical protein